MGETGSIAACSTQYPRLSQVIFLVLLYRNSCIHIIMYVLEVWCITVPTVGT